MNTSVAKLANIQLDLSNASGPRCGTGKPSSSYEKIAAQLRLGENGSGSISGVRATTNPAQIPIGGSPEAPNSPANQIVQGLAAGRYNLSRLTETVSSVQGTTPSQSLKGRLISIEQQYTQMNSALQNMPANATPQQWMALQQQMYSMSENIGTLSKMVSQMTSGVKTMLQTQV